MIRKSGNLGRTNLFPFSAKSISRYDISLIVALVCRALIVLTASWRPVTFACALSDGADAESVAKVQADYRQRQAS